MYLCMKYESNISMNQKIQPGNHYSYEIKAHNSDNNQWIISFIELDPYFMIINMNPIYQCIQMIWSVNHYSYKIMGHNSDNNRPISTFIELDLYLNIHISVYEIISNTPIISNISHGNHFSYVCTSRTDVRTRVMLYAPSPIKWRGHKNSFIHTKCIISCTDSSIC